MGERVIVEAWAPGRINLIGEHTDYNGGLALPMAINRGTHVEMRSIDVPEIRLRSAQIDAPEVVVSISEIMRAEMPLWARYVVGTLWVLGIEDRGRGLDITINGDLPLGSGLSSSASLEVGVAYAACKLLKLDLGAGQIAHLCQRAENEFVGAPTGDLDQVAVTQCPAESALVYNAAEGTAQTISLAPILRKCEILVINTGVSHQLARGEYANRRSECESAARSLGVTHLSDLEQGTGLEALEIPHLIARTRHVVTENARVLRAVAACARGDEVELGGLMTESHASLRDDFNVSWPELDAAVETALQLDALGARMTGGGFGGSAIALVSREHSNAVIQSLPSLVVRRGFHPPEVFAVAPTGPAHIVATQAEGSR